VSLEPKKKKNVSCIRRRKKVWKSKTCHVL